MHEVTAGQVGWYQARIGQVGLYQAQYVQSLYYYRHDTRRAQWACRAQAQACGLAPKTWHRHEPNGNLMVSLELAPGTSTGHNSALRLGPSCVIAECCPTFVHRETLPCWIGAAHTTEPCFGCRCSAVYALLLNPLRYHGMAPCLLSLISNTCLQYMQAGTKV